MFCLRHAIRYAAWLQEVLHKITETNTKCDFLTFTGMIMQHLWVIKRIVTIVQFSTKLFLTPTNDGNMQSLTKLFFLVNSVNNFRKHLLLSLSAAHFKPRIRLLIWSNTFIVHCYKLTISRIIKQINVICLRQKFYLDNFWSMLPGATLWPYIKGKGKKKCCWILNSYNTTLIRAKIFAFFISMDIIRFLDQNHVYEINATLRPL